MIALRGWDRNDVREWDFREAHDCICRCGKTYVSQTRYRDVGGYLQLESRDKCRCGSILPLTAGGIPEDQPAANA